MNFTPNPGMTPNTFASLLLLLIGAIGLGMLFYAPVLGVMLLTLGAAVAWYKLSKN